MRLTGGKGAFRLSAVWNPIMPVRTASAAPASVAPVRLGAASIVEAAAAVCATCWWHGRVHHYGH